MEERFGPWLIGRRLATGGLAEVTTARPWSVDVDSVEIALKRLHPHQARDAAVAALFEDEVKLTRDIPPHPRLVRGLGNGAVDERPWLALDLVDGADLRRRLDAGERPTPPVALGLIADACAAAGHLHDHGWVHGDVNPANLLVGGDGRVTLCDLGVARPLGAGGPVRGTHAYMAPEQVRGEAWTAATDVFALGVILWELCAGARLFYRGPTYLTMAAVVDGEAPALDDAELDAVVRAALMKDPRRRTPSAHALGAALAELAARRGWA